MVARPGDDNGQLTGNTGIHSRYETTMLDRNPQALQLDADTQARVAAGGSVSSDTYDAGLWSRTITLTLARMTGASVGTAPLVYTARVDAGSPAVPGSTVGAGNPGPGTGTTLALTAGPVPAQGALVRSYVLPAAATPAFELLDVRGRRVARVVVMR